MANGNEVKIPHPPELEDKIAGFLVASATAMEQIRTEQLSDRRFSRDEIARLWRLINPDVMGEMGIKQIVEKDHTIINTLLWVTGVLFVGLVGALIKLFFGGD